MRSRPGDRELRPAVGEPGAHGWLASGYGFGWSCRRSVDTRTRALRRNGRVSAEILRLPDDRLTVIVLTNSHDANPVAMAGTLRPSSCRVSFTPRFQTRNRCSPQSIRLLLACLDAEVYAKDLSPEFLEKVRLGGRRATISIARSGPPLGIERVQRDSGDARCIQVPVRYAETL